MMEHLPDFISIQTLTYDPDVFPEQEALLSPTERRRMQGFGSPRRRIEFVLGRAAARELLQLRLGSAPEIEVMSGGEPACMGGSLFVSISHTATMAAAAVAPCPVGIDLEVIRKRPDALTAYIEHAEDRAVVYPGSLDVTERLMLAWTLKEAVLKARGVGLRIRPSRLQVVPGTITGLQVIDERGKRWNAAFERVHACWLSVAWPAGYTG